MDGKTDPVAHGVLERVRLAAVLGKRACPGRFLIEFPFASRARPKTAASRNENHTKQPGFVGMD